MVTCTKCGMYFLDIYQLNVHQTSSCNSNFQFKWIGNNGLGYEDKKVEKVEETIAPAEVEITEVINDILELLLDKNRKYGNSALEPIRIFSKSGSTEQLRVRIDDKLSRVVAGQSDEDEDVLDDLLGYVVLLKIAMKREKNVQS